MKPGESIPVSKLETYIPGFDPITAGGLPAGRSTLVSGTAGSGKTVLAVQFLAAGIERAGEHGVFVTLEESPQEIRDNMRGFGWDIETWEREQRWAFVDAGRQPEDPPAIVGEYDLGALLARIENAVRTTGARRVAIDSLGAVFSRFPDDHIVRSEICRVAAALKPLGVTTVLTSERIDDYGPITRYGIEEFVSDNVVILRNALDGEQRRRTVEILKFRGAFHQKGQFPFTIRPGEGIVIIPLSGIHLEQAASSERIPSGIPKLDVMCGGGLFRGALALVTGATGTGKTLMATHFLAGARAANQRSLLFSFEESREQLIRNAGTCGMDLRALQETGLLAISCAYPEVANLEDHLIAMKMAVDRFQPDRVVVDSLSALERISSEQSFRELVIGLTAYLRQDQRSVLLTSDAPTLLGGVSITEKHISSFTDTIIALRYVELQGEIRRCLAIIKMRGSDHDRTIHEFTIDGTGLHLGPRFRNVSGILSGNPAFIASPVGISDQRDRGPGDDIK